jgi:hypothetical protein
MKLRVEGDDVVVDQGQQKQCADGQHDMVDVTSVADASHGHRFTSCVKCGLRNAVMNARDPEFRAWQREQDRLKDR